jgi:hypothetical protein
MEIVFYDWSLVKMLLRIDGGTISLYRKDIAWTEVGTIILYEEEMEIVYYDWSRCCTYVSYIWQNNISVAEGYCADSVGNYFL